MLEDKFAKFSKKQRIDHDITQEELAENANVSIKSVSTIENGKKVRDSTLVKVAKFFGYNINITRDIDFEKITEKISSIDDILNSDLLESLEDDSEGLYELKHIPKDQKRGDTDFVSRRKSCKDFDKYEPRFKEVQKELSEGKRKMVKFKEDQLNEGNYFVHNGILLYLEKIINKKKDKFGKWDGRTRIIFENGTESGMKLRSLGKNLFDNGKGVTINIQNGIG